MGGMMDPLATLEEALLEEVPGEVLPWKKKVMDS